MAEPAPTSGDEQVWAIEIEKLNKTFAIPFRRERLHAVRDLTLQVGKGQVYGLLGPNGSGKSTAMKIILGLLKPDTGRTAIFGQDSSKVESREQVGFLPENPYFYRFLTGLETLRFYGKLCSLKGQALTDRCWELLRLVDLEGAAHRRLGGYSKGMLQRIGLAQALIQHPRLLVLDEPTAGVDPAGARDIKNLIMRLKDEGITILLCSHLLAQVQEICDRIGILHRGELVREGPLEELIAIEDQTELILKGATPDVLKDLQKFLKEHGVTTLRESKPQTTLENYFLEVTGEEDQP